MSRDEFRNALRTLVWSATGALSPLDRPGSVATDLPLDVVCEELAKVIAELKGTQ